MGLFSSKSSSSSSTTNIYNTDNSNIGASSEEGPAVAIRGDGNQVELTDQGAVMRAFDFGGRALDFADAQGERAIDFAARVAADREESARNLVENYGNRLQAFAETSARNVTQLAASVSKGESERMAEIVRYAIIAAALVVGARYLKGAK